MNSFISEREHRFLLLCQYKGVATENMDEFVNEIQKWVICQPSSWDTCVVYLTSLAIKDIPMPWEPEHEKKRLEWTLKQMGI